MILQNSTIAAPASLINSVPVQEWGFGFGDRLFISGPCSVESPMQVMETALQLESTRIDVLRGGIWKPRTRPNTFEGVGAIGLKWLKDAGDAIGKPVCVEVANASHVKLACQAGIDILWLGARTTVNPFAVQEIADALKGIDIPVMIKNPINPDLELWIGAFERICLAGIQRVAAIHRGFSVNDVNKYRNEPLWEIPIAFHQKYPDVPMICDPSHIGGNKMLLSELSQKAFDLCFDGIMVETHSKPESALSDAKQQITPERYGEIINKLIFKDENINDTQALRQLEFHRGDIDNLDQKLINILAKRLEISVLIGEIKKRKNITVLQNNRWLEMLGNRIQLASEKGLSKNFITGIMETIHTESIRQQANIQNK